MAFSQEFLDMMFKHFLLTSSVDLALTTSSISVMIPRTLIAVRNDMADRFALAKRSRFDKRHSFTDAETSDKAAEVFRL